MSTDLSRRQLLKQSAAVVGAEWAKLVLPALGALTQAAHAANEGASDFITLESKEAREFEAIAERLIPGTDTPGARDVGVIHFLDQTFQTFNAPMLEPARQGLQALQDGIDGDRLFSELSIDEQDAYLESQQATPFFGMLRFLTLCGYFGLSKYGGNKDGAGWELVGMSPLTHVYTSPFGYYDAEYLKENPHG